MSSSSSGSSDDEPEEQAVIFDAPTRGDAGRRGEQVQRKRTVADQEAEDAIKEAIGLACAELVQADDSGDEAGDENDEGGEGGKKKRSSVITGSSSPSVSNKTSRSTCRSSVTVRTGFGSSDTLASRRRPRRGRCHRCLRRCRLARTLRHCFRCILGVLCCPCAFLCPGRCASRGRRRSSRRSQHGDTGGPTSPRSSRRSQGSASPTGKASSASHKTKRSFFSLHLGGHRHTKKEPEVKKELPKCSELKQKSQFRVAVDELEANLRNVNDDNRIIFQPHWMFDDLVPRGLLKKKDKDKKKKSAKRPTRGGSDTSPGSGSSPPSPRSGRGASPPGSPSSRGTGQNSSSAGPKFGKRMTGAQRRELRSKAMTKDVGAKAGEEGTTPTAASAGRTASIKSTAAQVGGRQRTSTFPGMSSPKSNSNAVVLNSKKKKGGHGKHSKKHSHKGQEKKKKPQQQGTRHCEWLRKQLQYRRDYIANMYSLALTIEEEEDYDWENLDEDGNPRRKYTKVRILLHRTLRLAILVYWDPVVEFVYSSPWLYWSMKAFTFVTPILVFLTALGWLGWSVWTNWQYTEGDCVVAERPVHFSLPPYYRQRNQPLVLGRYVMRRSYAGTVERPAGHVLQPCEVLQPCYELSHGPKFGGIHEPERCVKFRSWNWADPMTCYYHKDDFWGLKGEKLYCVDLPSTLDREFFACIISGLVMIFVMLIFAVVRYRQNAATRQQMRAAEEAARRAEEIAEHKRKLANRAEEEARAEMQKAIDEAQKEVEEPGVGAIEN